MNIFLYIILTLAVYFIFFVNMEGLESTPPTEKIKINSVVCKDCKLWNHLDARSKCDGLCKMENPDKDVHFTGNFNQSMCECSNKVKYNKKYIGCPTGKSLGNDENCFLWNDTEAKEKCKGICDKFLPKDIQSKWTGNWKPTSIETSACECEYYT